MVDVSGWPQDEKLLAGVVKTIQNFEEIMLWQENAFSLILQ